MAQAIPAIISTAVSAYGAYSSYKSGKEAEKEAELLTDAQMSDEANKTKAEQAERRARLAASGVQSTGSSALFMNEAKKQDDKRLDYMKRTGDYRASALRSQGNASALGSLSKIPGYWT